MHTLRFTNVLFWTFYFCRPLRIQELYLNHGTCSVLHLNTNSHVLIGYQQRNHQRRLCYHVMNICVLRESAAHEGPNRADVSIIIEGTEVLDDCRYVAKVCLLIMGFIYTMNLSYPPKMKYTFEVFQKLFLELDVLKMSPKVQSLCSVQLVYYVG